MGLFLAFMFVTDLSFPSYWFL